MAKQIKVLKCPQCGNTKPENKGSDHYHCGKCGTEFFLDSDDININVHHRHDHQNTVGTSQPPGKGCIGAVAAIVGLAVFMIVGKLVLSSIFSSPETTHHFSVPQFKLDRVLVSAIYPMDDKAVSVSVERRWRVDSLHVTFKDIETGDLIREIAFPMEDETARVVYQKFPGEDAGYFIVAGNQILKLDYLKNSLTDFTMEVCDRKPALGAGIMKAAFVPDGCGEGFQFHTNLGKDLYYFPAPDLLCTEEAYMYMRHNKPLDDAKKETYYLFLNKESSHSGNVAQLLCVEYLYNAGGPENKLLKADTGRLKKPSLYRISSFKPITEEFVCFSPRVLYSDNTHILVAFEPTLAADAGTTVQLLDITGKVEWSVPFTERLSVKESIKTTGGYMLSLEYDEKELTFIQISRDGKTHRQHKLSK